MREKIIAGNWKMNKTIPDTIKFITELKTRISGKRDVEIVIAPPYTSINSAIIAAQNTQIKIAGQNMYYEDSGAFTGEVSALMLSEIGCLYVILGHSERRKYFGETDSFVNKKIGKALENDLIPIVCVGETLEERKAGKTYDVLDVQIRDCFKGFRIAEIEKRAVIAYEPVWAIGTGTPATPKDAQAAHQFIRRTMSDIFGAVISDKISILYGGSVTPENIKELMKEPDIDGALVGGASLDPKSFAKIISFDEE